MRTDLLSRIIDSEQYLEELVYQLNGDYPQSKFILWKTWGGDWVIFTNEQSVLDFEIDFESDFSNKFPWELFTFQEMNGTMYNSYLLEKEYELV